MVEFSVEVPGEANPLDEAALERTLRAAASRDVHQIQTGTKQLQRWETADNYFPLLQTSQPTEVRLLSLIQLKNGIDKYWRRSAANAVRASERTIVRDRLLQGSLLEPVDKVASLNAIVTGKIARYEYPGQWPNLMKDLVDILGQSATSQAPYALARALLLTHYIVKELATVRLTKTRAAFIAAVPSLLTTLRDLYFYKLGQWQDRIAGDFDQAILRPMNESEQCLKILRRLLVSGYDFPHRNAEVQGLWEATFGHVQLYMQNAYRISASQHAKQLAKMHVNLAKDHMTSFALLPNSMNLVRQYWHLATEFRQRQLDATGDIDDDETDVYDSFNLRAVLILRSCFAEAFNLSQPFKYRNSESKDEPPKGRQILTNDLLNSDYVRDLFHTLVGKFFIYIQSDIEESISEPEEWDLKDESDGDAYDRSIRAAAERLFLDITLHYKDLVIEPLLRTIDGVADAIYSAIGVAAPILSGKFDFSRFMSTTLVRDLQSENQGYSIVRRRVAIVLSKWVVIDVREEMRFLVYEMFHKLLDPKEPLNNVAVRITAAKHLRDAVDEITFKAEVFSPYASVVMARLLDLIREVSLPETKLAILNTVSTIVTAMREHVSPFAEQIVSLLQVLWVESESENLMKAVIVTVLRKLVRSMKAASAPLHPIMLQTVKATVEPGSDLQVYLLEDALDLWMAVMEQIVDPALEEALVLIPYIFPLLETEDALPKALRILRSYVLLAPQQMLQDDIRHGLFNALLPLLKLHKKPAIIDDAVSAVELLFRYAEGMGGEQAVHIVMENIMQTGFLPHIFESLYLNWEHHETTGPKRKEGPPDWKNETNYYSLVARLIMLSTNTFLTASRQFAELKSLEPELFVQRIVDEAFNHVDVIASPSQMKLLTMAVTKLFETNQQWVLVRLQSYMSLWTTMIGQLRNSPEDKTTDNLVYTPPTDQEARKEDPESARSAAVMYADVVHRVDLGQYISHHLRAAIAAAGGEAAFQAEWLTNVDGDVVKAFGELGIM